MDYLKCCVWVLLVHVHCFTYSQSSGTDYAYDTSSPSPDYESSIVAKAILLPDTSPSSPIQPTPTSMRVNQSLGVKNLVDDNTSLYSSQLPEYYDGYTMETTSFSDSVYSQSSSYLNQARTSKTNNTDIASSRRSASYTSQTIQSTSSYTDLTKTSNASTTGDLFSSSAITSPSYKNINSSGGMNVTDSASDNSSLSTTPSGIFSTTPSLTQRSSSPGPNTSVTTKEPGCGAIRPGPYVNIIYVTGSEVIFTCPLGMRLNGSMTSTCKPSGAWSNPVPDCNIIACSPPDVPQNGFISPSFIPTYLFNQTVYIGCNAGYTLQGLTSRLCKTDGQWSGLMPKCIMAQPGECPMDTDDRNTIWNKTRGGQVLSKQCMPGYYGSITRQCTMDGQWLLPFYDCVRKTIEELSQIVAGIVETQSEEIVEEVLSNLTKETNIDDVMSIQEGDILMITEMLDVIAKASRNITVNEQQKTNFIRTTSNLVDEKNINSWKAIEQDIEENQVVGVMRAVEVYADSIVSSSNPFNDSLISTRNIVFSVTNVDIAANEDLMFPLPDYRDELNTTSFYTLPRQALKDVKHTSSVYYKTIDKILPSYDKGRKPSEEISINSAVLSLKLTPRSSDLSAPLTLHFDHFDDTLENPICSYWNFTKNGWNSDGCSVSKTTNTLTVCTCKHLTNFAILMSPYKQVVSEALSIITIVGSSISLILLGVTFVIHMFLWRYVKSDRVFILMNLVIALVISYALFIFGVERTENKTVCTTIAVALHYFLLLVFFMMLCVTMEIALSVVFVFGSKRRRSLLLLPVGWGVPFVIVTASASMKNLDGYGTTDYCWLSITDGLIWAFVGPAIFVLSVNAILLVAILKKMHSTRFMSQKTNKEKLKATIRSLCVLLPVMGITWLLGVFYVNGDTQWIQYVFAILNSLQGLAIFIFHCVLNKQVHVAIRHAKRKYSVTTSNDVKMTKSRS